ncbi:MAG: hypothetical protein ABIL46_05965, partial [candidate division WOR-3 bacterium]
MLKYGYLLKRTTLVVVFLLSLSTADSLNVRFIGSCDTPQWAVGIYVSDIYGYVADVGGLQIIDISDPYHPFIASNIYTPNEAGDVYVSGAYAYIADGTDGLRVVKVLPTEKSYYNIIGSSAVDLFVVGSFIYVADEDWGLRILTGNGEVGYYDTPGWVEDVYVVGNYAYVADLTALRIIDVSNPSTPYEVGSCGMPYPAMTVGVYVSGSYAYMAVGDSGLCIVNISNPSSPYIMGKCVTPGSANAVFVSGSYAYVADASGGLRVIDVSEPSNPYEVSHCSTPDW